MPEETEQAGLRVFLAGATGVIGARLVPLLIAGGHTVAGLTRSAEKAGPLRQSGAEPVVCDVFDAAALTAAVVAFAPDVVMHQLTDLPDRASEIAAFAARNDRIRTEGTRNLIAAARAAGAGHFLAQSIAWRPAALRASRNTSAGSSTPRASSSATDSCTVPAPTTRLRCRHSRAFTSTPPPGSPRR
jgi:hypothetical protein